MKTIDLDIRTPKWAKPLLEPSRYKGAHGGRGSGKSHFFGESVIEAHVTDPHKSTVCLREVQKSIKMSVKRLIEQKIQKLGVGDLFKVQDSIIKSRRGRGLIIFEGMQSHNADSIKSLEDFDCAWFEEAQRASQKSLDLLRPTLRKPGSELWFSWNPSKPSDPVDQLFRGANRPPSCQCIQVNYMDNPWFPDVLQQEMEYDKRRDDDKYNWIWLGGYEKLSAAQVFRNWRIEEFETDPDAVFRFGADWGFSIDPTVLVRMYIKGRTIYIDYEAYQVGCEIIDIPDLFLQIPESEKWPIVADSARPETISHVRKHGFKKIRRSVKGAGSLKEGIEFLKTYDIVIHPRCIHVADEFLSYSYKVDDLTQAILPELVDKKNHVIDAARYALEGDRRLMSGRHQEIPRAIPVSSPMARGTQRAA